MDVNFNRLKLKLDMAYRDLPAEEAQKRFTELSVVPEEKPLGEFGVKRIGPEKKKPKRKVVKALVPANK
jgi:hypothetical protein